MKLRALFSALTLPLITLNTYALTVGEMTVNSNLGEPLALSINVSAESKVELDSLAVRLAPRAAFKQSGVPYPENADTLQFSIDVATGGNATLNVSTLNALDTPYLHLLMQLSWSGGKVLREYVALIDPAGYGETAQTQTIAVSEPVLESNNLVAAINQSEDSVTVKRGDTISAIAKRYRPSDISMQQAWVAFYNLNKGAFSSNNINLLQRGARLTIPTREQMLAVSQTAAIKEVRALSPGSTTPAVTPVATQNQTTQDVLTIGAQSVALSSAEVGGVNSAAVEQMLEGNFGEMASIKEDLNKFGEEMVAVRGENKVVTERLSQIESQLSRISQLLEMQSQLLATLNEEARLQVQSIANANAEVQAQAQATESAEASQQQLQQLNQLAQQQSTEIQALQGPTVEPLTSGTLNAAATTLVKEPETTENIFDVNTIQPSATDTVAKTANQSFENAQTDPNAASNVQQLQQTITGQDADTVGTAAFQTALAVESAAAPAVSEEEHREQIAGSEAALQEKIAQARRKQNLPAEPNQTNGESFLNTDEWIGSVVSVKNTLVDSLKGGAEKLGDSSFFDGLAEILKKWSLYIVAGILALIGLGSFMHRRTDNEIDEEFEQFDDDIQADIDRSLADEKSEFSSTLGESSVFNMSDESLMQDAMPSEPAGGNSSLFFVDEQDPMREEMRSEAVAMAQQSTIEQVMDVDPLTEAEVYLAYDRKEQAIKVLKDAYATNPKDQNVAVKLLSLYQGIDDADSFDRVLETAFANRAEDSEDQWPKIEVMGKNYAPTHSLFLDNDFDGSIPVLDDEIGPAVATDAPGLAAKVLSAKADNDIEDLVVPAAAALAATAADTAAEYYQFPSLPADNDGSELDEYLEDLIDLKNVNEDDDALMDLSGLTGDAEGNIAETVEVEAEAGVKGSKTDVTLGDLEDVEENPMDSGSFSLEMDNELNDAVKGTNQHDPDTSLALAKAYIELGEQEIAKEFLTDVIDTGSAKLKTEARSLLTGLG